MSTPKVLLSRTENTAAEPFAMPFYKQLICITFSCIWETGETQDGLASKVEVLGL